MADHEPDDATAPAGSGTGEVPPRQAPDDGVPGPAGPASDPAGDGSTHPAPGHPDPAAQDLEARDLEADQQDYHELTGALNHRVQQVYNTFYGRVDAAESVFGFGAATSPGLAPGLVEPAEIGRVLAHYLHPDAYDETAGRLQSDHLVVLAGEEGSGRRAGAFAMLRDLLGEDAALRSLSPANSLTHLAAKGTVKPASGYVILDYAGETESDAVQDYNLKKLQDELRRRGSYLVLTASPADRRRLALKAHCVPWTPPGPLPLFEHCADQMYGAAFLSQLPAATLDELRALVAELWRPRDIVRAARQLANGTQAALEDLRDSAKQTVREWFQKSPGREDLLPIAALAFAEGLPERTFEELVVLLDDYVRNGDRPAGEPVSDEDAVPVTRPPLRQSRAAWSTRASGIAAPVHRGDRCRSERTIVFASPRVRGLVIGELHALYGYELWYPLRRWLNQLALEGGPRVREEVARGVALLARHALPEVEENLLPSWSDGLSSQRLTAAFVLQFMCGDERLAPQALATALSWSKRGNRQLRAITAAMAFAGEAGALYRLDALNCLWGMTVRGQRVAAAARRSLVLLLATAAAEAEAERAEFSLRYFRTQLAHARDPRDRTLALESVLQVLEAEGLTPGVPLTAELLQRHPPTARHLGSLWSTVLLSMGRARAVTALVRTLAALQDVRSATGSVRELGEAMRGALDRRQWQGLQANVSVAVRHPDYAIPGTQHLVQVLLGNLRRHGSTSNSLSLQGG
ncbi:hypothetical protein ACO0M4_11285 [Streptomyces sp. RGM 3693]|uniref:hypothetical protein n=1 Tax=Streptomyces sp. RGM 3693 TaxID=3413284 RepID=UPI003D2D58A3